jgi:hypothetical protein
MHPPRRDPHTVKDAPTPIQGGQIMFRYLYAWTPVVIVVGTLVVLSSSILALIVLLALSLAAVAALAWAIVWVPLALSRSVSRLWHSTGSTPRTAPALSPARRHSA